MKAEVSEAVLVEVLCMCCCGSKTEKNGDDRQEELKRLALGH